MARWLLCALLLVSSVAVADETIMPPEGPTTDVPPVPTQEEITRALLAQWVEAMVRKSELISEAEAEARFIWAYEWMIDELAPGDLLDLITISVRHSRLRLADLEQQIALAEAEMARLRYLLGW